MDSEYEGKIADLAERAVRYMVHDLGAERAVVVLLKGAAARPTVMAQYGFPTDDIWKEPTAHQQVLNELLDGEPTIFVMDSRTHPHYRSAESHRSLVGTPIPMGGFLYCDHGQSGALKMDAAVKLEKYCSGFVRRSQSLAARQHRKPSETVEQIKKSKFLMSLLAFLLCVVGVTGFHFLSGPPDVILPQDVEKQVYEVTLKGRLLNFSQGATPSPKGKFKVKFPGGDTLELVTRDLNFDPKGNFTIKAETKMAKPPSLAVMTIKLPRFKSESLRARVVESEAVFKDLTLAGVRRRRGRDSTRSDDPEAASLERLSRTLESKRPRKRRSRKSKR